MKQHVYRDAVIGIQEYQSDPSSRMDNRSIDERRSIEAFNDLYTEIFLADKAADRKIMLDGFDPLSGERYTADEFSEVLERLEPTPEERRELSLRLAIEHDMRFDQIEEEQRLAWADYQKAQHERDLFMLNRIGDANLDAIIASHAAELGLNI